MKELYKQTRKEATELYKKCMGVMIILMTGFYLFKNYVIFPLISKAWSLALSTIPSQFITDASAGTFLKYPYLLLIGALIILLYCVVVVWELSAIMLLFAYYDQNRPVKLLRLMYISLLNIRQLAKRKNWLFFVFVMLILPFTDLYSAAGMVYAIPTPEYIAEFIENSKLLYSLITAAYILLVWLTVRWFYALQGVLMCGQDFRRARENSVKLIHGRMLQQTIDMIRYLIDRLIKVALIPFLISVAFILLSIKLTESYTGALLGTKVAYYMVFNGVFLAVADAFVRMAMMSYLVVNYRIFASKEGIYEKPELPESGDKKGRAHLFPHLGTTIYAAIAAGSILMYVSILFLANVAPEELGMLKSSTLIAAHKGYSSEAPENTMDSFEKAFESGNVNLIELDVRESKDGIPIVIHNASLKNACGVNEEVYDLDYADIRAYKADYTYTSEEYPDAYIPTLEEVLAAFGNGDVTLLIEIKADSRTPELPEKIVDLIHEYDCADHCVIHSGNYASLEAVKKADPSIPCGFIIAMATGNYFDMPCADFFSVEHNFVNKSMIENIHKRGKKVYVWTVDELSSITDMLLLDVDVIITDYPDNVHDWFYSNNDLIDNIVKSEKDRLSRESRDEGRASYEEGDY